MLQTVCTHTLHEDNQTPAQYPNPNFPPRSTDLQQTLAAFSRLAGQNQVPFLSTYRYPFPPSRLPRLSPPPPHPPKSSHLAQTCQLSCFSEVRANQRKKKSRLILARFALCSVSSAARIRNGDPPLREELPQAQKLCLPPRAPVSIFTALWVYIEHKGTRCFHTLFSNDDYEFTHSLYV
ncbi:hypothetical protein BC835DRAFT_766015 [Cytidiella melzeri]|nr:hypothetical protein BC835DRAFT_766015 [Cytidiella melzeri]